MQITNFEDAVRVARNEGFRPKTHECYDWRKKEEEQPQNLAIPEEITNDPAFWKAIGKALRWGVTTPGYYMTHWHRYLDFLDEGKEELYWKELR